MKIELNLPALERLIGGDTEIELQLRRQIVERFTKERLLPLATSEAMSAAMAEVRKLVSEKAKELFDVSQLASPQYWPIVEAGGRLDTLLAELVKKKAQAAVDEAVTKIIDSQKKYWGVEINRAVDRAVNAEIEKRVEEGIRQRLDRAKNLEETANG